MKSTKHNLFGAVRKCCRIPAFSQCPHVIRNVCFVIAIFHLFLPSGIFAQNLDAYTIKAIFLERFTRFVEWPPEAAINDKLQPFIIAVIGKNPFGTKLDTIYSTRKIRDKKVKIIYICNVNELVGCHLLFVSESEKNEFYKIISLTRDKPILTIGDAKGFAENGGLMNFYTLDNLIRFEVNEKAIRESGLSMSYLLLKAARIVKPGEVSQ
ncbi:MAG: YfiR family protein [Deltaproteobacteria bacterium]|nr:YfiR family protein [Deltaproteobacteria bacterium]